MPLAGGGTVVVAGVTAAAMAGVAGGVAALEGGEVVALNAALKPASPAVRRRMRSLLPSWNSGLKVAIVHSLRGQRRNFSVVVAKRPVFSIIATSVRVITVISAMGTFPKVATC